MKPTRYLLAYSLQPKESYIRKADVMFGLFSSYKPIFNCVKDICDEDIELHRPTRNHYACLIGS